MFTQGNSLTLTPVLLIGSLILASFNCWAGEVFIVSPKDGATVEPTFKVQFGAKEIEILPAGTDTPNSGHHHLIVDGKLPDLNKALGAEVQHFGKAQTETELTLEPGEHTLQLVLGDKTHTPHKPAVVSKKVTITVKTPKTAGEE